MTTTDDQPTEDRSKADDADLGGEVLLGSALFTLVEPHRGREVAYNRWYERDHFYAGCMVGPWYFAGRRWVATRELKDQRITSDAGPLFGDDQLGTYLATYWVLKGRFEENVDWSVRQVHWLHRNGRMFAERDHIHTLLYMYGRAESRDADGVPPELALDHSFQGLGAVIVERTGTDVPPRPTAALADGSPVALVLSFSAVPLPADAPVTQPGTEGLETRELQLWFADDEPGAWWSQARAYADEVASSGAGVVRWASPFVPTIPGTDTYTDQLW
jgi:hypothetical protein